MVDLDPEYSLDLVKRTLEPWREYYQGRASDPSRLPGLDEVGRAVATLECICHPSGLEYQRRLIEAEAMATVDGATTCPLGPSTQSGRNDALVEDLAKWLAVAPSTHQQVGLVNYLRTAATVRAAEAIHSAASVRLKRIKKGDVQGSDLERTLRFEVHCLLALAEMQDARTVDLAGQLLEVPLFRRRHLRELCEELNKLRMANSVQLLEAVLEEASAEADQGLLEAILTGLAQWPERRLSPTVESLLGNRRLPPGTRALAWKVVVSRGGYHGLTRLREHLIGLTTRPKWTRATQEEAEELARAIGPDALALAREVELLLFRSERENCPRLTNELWAWLTVLNAPQSHLRGHQEWFMDSCLPALRARLGRTEDDSLQSWFNAFAGATDEVIKALADLIAPP